MLSPVATEIEWRGREFGLRTVQPWTGFTHGQIWCSWGYSCAAGQGPQSHLQRHEHIRGFDDNAPWIFPGVKEH